ncbi:MAG: class I SAM-dependent RNA methyltransferase [Candidatus Magasanikbacteria bacterium]|nr:class I SAM-dependent RNA methyltransferase [Candidatus Magasanikbacteria bacterium]
MRVHIEKLVFGGQGLGRTPEGRVVFVWNALPGEDVDVEIIKNRAGHTEAVATAITNPSPDRVAPMETHWLSSSPWQHLSWESELLWKKEIAAETYSKIGHCVLQSSDIDIATNGRQYGYRNKIEFSFTTACLPLVKGETEGSSISLAFFARGKRYHIPATGSLLAEPIINEVAQNILVWINTNQIPLRSLKTLIVRSDGAGHAIAALFIKDELAFTNYPTCSDTLLGFHLYYSTHKSPASVPTKKLYGDGQDYLIAELKSAKLKFGLLSFFQINLPIFDQALTDIAAWLDPKIPVVDYYCGVGAISLPLSLNRTETALIDNNAEAIQYARENIALNGRQNCAAHCVPAEDMVEAIDKDKMIILDPPRAGLHERVVRHLLARRPKRIIYLSCDLATQARDLQLLSESYALRFLKLYNFFPRTPHIEGLVILDCQTPKNVVV